MPSYLVYSRLDEPVDVEELAIQTLQESAFSRTSGTRSCEDVKGEAKVSPSYAWEPGMAQDHATLRTASL